MRSTLSLRGKAGLSAENTLALASVSQLLVADLDHTLIGDAPSMQRFFAWLMQRKEEVAFGVATGRNLASALQLLREQQARIPDVMVTSVGYRYSLRRAACSR